MLGQQLADCVFGCLDQQQSAPGLQELPHIGHGGIHGLGGMEYLARRLDEQGALLPDVTREQATDTLWMLCSFESFDSLYTGRGLSAREAADVVIAVAERSLYR